MYKPRKKIQYKIEFIHEKFDSFTSNDFFCNMPTKRGKFDPHYAFEDVKRKARRQHDVMHSWWYQAHICRLNTSGLILVCCIWNLLSSNCQVFGLLYIKHPFIFLIGVKLSDTFLYFHKIFQIKQARISRVRAFLISKLEIGYSFHSLEAPAWSFVSPVIVVIFNWFKMIYLFGLLCLGKRRQRLHWINRTRTIVDFRSLSIYQNQAKKWRSTVWSVAKYYLYAENEIWKVNTTLGSQYLRSSTDKSGFNNTHTHKNHWQWTFSGLRILRY